MDLYDSFCRAVCAHIPRATAREREDIVRELTHHMEDHARQLTEGGTEAAAARAQAVRAMGDPVEIGTKWNRQLSPFWLWTGRAAAAAVLLFAFLAVWNAAPLLRAAWDNWTVRAGQPPSILGEDPLEIWRQDLDLRYGRGATSVRFYELSVLDMPGGYLVQVAAVSCSQCPLRDGISLSSLTYEVSPRFSDVFEPSCSTTAGASYARFLCALPEERPPSVITITGSGFGNSFQAVIPLDWEAIL